METLSSLSGSLQSYSEVMYTKASFTRSDGSDKITSALKHTSL